MPDPHQGGPAPPVPLPRGRPRLTRRVRPAVVAAVLRILSVLVLFVLVPAVLVLDVSPAAAAGDPSPVGPGPSSPAYRPPLDRPVVDPFREPAGPFGPGNRGLEYATVPGDIVGAIGAGVVAFAGTVAGRRVVAVVHPDGLRSTYTGLLAVTVAVGDVVAPGTPVGAAGARLHLGVRRGRRYLDPAALFAARIPPRHAVLVPVLGRGARAAVPASHLVPVAPLPTTLSRRP